MRFLVATLRQLRQQKFFFLLNIVGLALGLASAMAILLFVRHELSFDRSHPRAERIYRLVTARISEGQSFTGGASAVSAGPAGRTLVETFPQVKVATRIATYFTSGDGAALFEVGEDAFYERRIMYADPEIFEVFDFGWIAGDPQTALDKPDAIVLSEAKAEKYFGSENPIGRALKIDGRDLNVTGVYDRVPRASHFHADFFISWKTQEAQGQNFSSWQQLVMWTYVVLAEGSDPKEVESELPALVERYVGPGQSKKMELSLQPLLDIHLHSNLSFELESNSHTAYVTIPGLVGVLILLIAGINFMNLATARSSHRAREVAVRKTLGATRGRLRAFFLGESVVFSFLALGLGLAGVGLMLPYVADLAGRQIGWQDLLEPRALAMIVLITVMVGLFSGSYPAFFLSAFRPARVLKGDLSAGGPWPVRLRKCLVILQFTLSVGLLVATGVARAQLDYMKNDRLGLNKERVIVLPEAQLDTQRESFRAELAKLSSVSEVGASTRLPGSILGVRSFVPEGASGAESQMMQLFFVDQGCLRALEAELLAGRHFDPTLDRPDITLPLIQQNYRILLNETAVRAFGWEWQAAIGRRLIWLDRNQNPVTHTTVVGVIRDFQYSSLRKAFQPTLIGFDPTGTQHLLVRMAGDNIAGTLDDVEKVWKSFLPNAPFEYSFLDQEFDKMYREEERLSRALAAFSGFAVFVACLGLFGLTAFMVERRQQEIAIRKALGATNGHILALLTRDFLALVLAGTAFGLPAAFLAMQRWLAGFAYQVSFDPWVYLSAAALAFVVALLTVGALSLRAAFMRPARALHYE